MPLDPPFDRRRVAVDLLVVGALTIDRFADGSLAPGGSVLHATRAAAASGYATAMVTIAGDEPEAVAALGELGRLGPIHAERAPQSVAFGHRETAMGRELVMDRAAPELACPPVGVDPAAVLYAPVANEFGSGLGGQRYDDAVRGAILQGWLRTLDIGHTVEPLSLDALPASLVGVLSGFDLLVASAEDLRTVALRPTAQLDAVRRHFGDVPLLVVTDGTAGAWLDERGTRTLVAPPTIVDGPTTVGAGDAFAAIMTAELARGTPARDAASLASAAVVRLLQSRVNTQPS